MIPPPTRPPIRYTPAQWAEFLRRLRAGYDALGRGERAALCVTSADRLRTTGEAWALLTRVFRPEIEAGTLTDRELGLLIVPLWLFPFAANAPRDESAFRTGAWLRNVFGRDRGAEYLRRLLDAHTLPALLAVLSAVLRGAGRTASVAWDTLGAELVFWQFTNAPQKIVREGWARDFYFHDARIPSPASET